MAGSSRKGRSLGTGRPSRLGHQRLGNHDQLGGAKSGFCQMMVLAETADQTGLQNTIDSSLFAAPKPARHDGSGKNHQR